MTLALTFLAPLAGIIAGAVGAPLLLLLYFLKLRRRPVRVSSTLLWERATADLQVNAPFRWIRFSWLLLLQLLLLGCVCLALARPALESGTTPTGRFVILIDRSASMSAVDATLDGASEPVSRLEQAKGEALELIDRLGSDARAVVIAFGVRAEALTNLTRDRGMLRNAIRSIRPTDETADLEQALRVAGAALTADAGADEPQPARVIVLSDGGNTGERLVAPPGIGGSAVEFLRAGPAQTEPKENFGIVALAAKRSAEDPGTVRVFVGLQSTMPAGATVALTCRLDDRVVSVDSVSFAPVPTPGDVATAAHTFEVQTTERAVLLVSAGIDDALAADDNGAIVLRPPGAPRILVVQPTVPQGVVDLLAIDALESLQPRALRVVTGAEYADLERAGALADFDLIVFDRVRPASLPARPSISFGATVPIPGLGVAPFEEDDPESAQTPFAFWQRAHPVMRFVGLGSVVVSRPMRVTLPGPDSETRIRAEVLASGSSGPLIVLIDRAGVRRIVVGFELADSRWWQDPSFPVFIKNAVDYLVLGGDDQAGRSFTPNESITVRAAPGAQSVEVLGPVAVRRPVGAGDSVVLGTLPLAGVYAVEGAAPDDARLAVNLASAAESAIPTRDTLTIAGSEVSAQGVGATAPREIWPWFVLAALVLLAFEWALFSWRMRV